MAEEIKVKISDYRITQPPNLLMTIGLGSCIGIALYEPKTKIGGLSHIMLPDSRAFKEATKHEKFADLAIPQMAAEIKALSGQARLVAKIAGGASMFQFTTETPAGNIGARNAAAVKQCLQELNIPLLGEHTGGNSGRTMTVDLATFEVTVRMVNREIIVL